MIHLRILRDFFYERIVLNHPVMVLIGILAVAGVFVMGARHFRLDASAETLVLEGDPDLSFSRRINALYGQGDLLMLTFRPHEDLFSASVLDTVGRLGDELRKIENLESVLTILDVPLLRSPPVSLSRLRQDTRTLESPDVDMQLARKEFAQSPLYESLLVSPDVNTTAILMFYPRDIKYEELLSQRDALRQKKSAGTMTEAERQTYGDVERQFVQYHDEVRQRRHQDIQAIRAVAEAYRSHGTLHLGGVSMIADDMISFIKSDLRIFGTAVFLLLVLTIAVIFRSVHWVVLPMVICAASVVCTVGLLGWAGWEVTVISSNFISLQLIITLSMTIHLMVRYREFAADLPKANQRELILLTLNQKILPCLYSALTTIAGFLSLVFSDIRPVISFGYIMVVGAAVSFVVPFLILPAVLALLPRDVPASSRPSRWQLPPMLARFTQAWGPWIAVAAVVVLIANLVGISRLEVENSFIDYFKSNTEIHRGMKVVDRELGGTTPLDIVIDFESAAPSEAALSGDAGDPDDDVFDLFEDVEAAAEETRYRYWFTPEKVARIAAVHDYLDGLPEIGKVLSVVTLTRMVEQALERDEPLDGMELALLFNQIPEDLTELLVRPYVSVEHDQVRLAVRMRDSDPDLNRNDLLNTIRLALTETLAFAPEQVHLAGTMVLYNNMLQSLFRSQAVTLGFTALLLMGAFWVSFRSLWIAVIALIPNILAVSCVLSVMGWLNIPLDMMTITIAAIAVGMAVDNTIHYVYRFRDEVEGGGRYLDALHRSHNSIGHAMYYTTVTLVIGFSILSLSNFIPTIYFGVLTVLAFIVALLASLTLLPYLLVLTKPFGPESPVENRKENEV